ncbi:RNA polymerase sigma factor [Streptomyces liangshanensis]|uniref:Sigma-70 family RNA polymerase sigma factor n=1 Tax=Streptomyces liangshanensis TaxID=2717324 RepID=A0A6G9H3C8_9ACTN|nr:sigma-70 family RNA polymerase sigma factor [Streptomyces liangshanensis]QIQ04806.1 sigma-70 family RNA polymerase sigma factor [Streptomyces liangshanensis]
MRIRRSPGAAADPLDEVQAGRVRAVLALGGVPQADLPDGLQQVRLRLLERRARGQEPPRDVGAWAAVVASNLAADWHRTHHRQERVSARLTLLSAPDAGVQGGPESGLLAMAVAEALDGLPEAQRQVLVLRYYADLSVPRIAEELGIPVGTVKSRLFAAAKLMRERLRLEEVV